MRAFVAFLLFILLLSPKINIISMPGYNAGLRIDDMIISLIFLCFFAISLARVNLKIERRYSSFVFAMLISTVVSYFIYGQGSLLFPARFIEYAIFIYIGFYLYKSGGSIMVFALNSFFITNSVVALLQWQGLLGGFTVYGYSDFVGDRVVGLTAGPWELGVILNMATAYYLTSSSSVKIKALSALSLTFIILLTGSRMAFIANIIVLSAYLLNKRSAASKIGIIISLIPFFGIIAFMASGTSLAERSANIFNYSNISDLSNIFHNTKVDFGNPDWELIAMMDIDGADMSWSMRVVKWIYAIKMFSLDPYFWFFGVGAGTFGNALDGGWLRVIIECGIVGFLLFVSFLSTVKKQSYFLYLSVIAISINMIMIDIYMSYKVMSVLLLCYGFSYMKNKTEIQ